MKLPLPTEEERTRRDWLVDWAAFAFALLLGVLSAVDALSPDVNPLILGLLVVTGAACLFSLFYRRRWPVGVGIFTAAVSLFNPLVGGAFLVALFNVAIRRPWKAAAALSVFTAVSYPLYNQMYPSSQSWWEDMLWLVLIVSGIVAWGMYVRARRELLETLRERARDAEADRDLRLTQAREQERTRIAREMHDVLAHRISLVALNAGALEFRPDASPEEVQEAAAVVRANAHLALDELRDVISVLRDQPQGENAAKEPPQPTLDHVEALIDESRQSGAEVEFELRLEDTVPVPDSTGRTAYRVAQEGLTNFRKHAAGGSAVVFIEGSPGDGLTVEVMNRRPLIEPAGVQMVPDIPGSGTGLIGLSERVELAGGTLDHGPQPDGQFRLRAWLPWST